MDFSIERTDFPSEVHKVIYSAAREIIPLEYSLNGIDDESLKQSCEDYHQFIMELLSDMYEFPEAYSLSVYELEQFLDGKKLNGMKQKYPSRTKSILSHTRNSVERYIALLCRIAFMGTVHDDCLELHSEVLPSLEKAVNTSSSPISLEKRLEALSRVGFVQTNTGFRSNNHPHMFLSMCKLAEKTKGTTSGFTYYNFSKCDFRNIIKNHKPTHVDYFWPLIDERKKVAYELHNIAIEYGCREQINTFLKTDYKYKGNQVLLIDSADGDLDIRITEAYKWDGHSLINDRLEKETTEFQTYALRHLWRCTACATTHLGQFIEVLGTRNRVCGGGMIGFQWHNPSGEDIKFIRRFLQMRCEIINEINQRKS